MLTQMHAQKHIHTQDEKHVLLSTFSGCLFWNDTSMFLFNISQRFVKTINEYLSFDLNLKKKVKVNEMILRMSILVCIVWVKFLLK